MKINSNENVLMMNKNVRKMGAEPAPVPTTPVANPENTMKAMDLMSQQNISFQGGSTKMLQETAGKVVKKGAKRFGENLPKNMIALAAYVMTIAPLASCTKETIINVNVEQDYSALSAAFTTAMQGLQQQLSALTVLVANMQKEQAVQTEVLRQQITSMNNVYQEMLKTYNKLVEMSEKQDKTNSELEAIKSQLEEYCKNSIEQMKNIMNLLGTDSPIYQKLSEILDEYKAGKKSAQEAYEAMMEVLNSIDSKMDVLINQNEDIKTSFAEVLKNQVEQGKISQEYADKFLKAYEEIKAEIEAGNITDANYYTASYQHWVAEDAQRDVIIQILTNNGYTLEQATKYLEGLDTKAAKNEESAKEAFNEVMEVLNNINSNLNTLVKEFKEFRNDYNTSTDKIYKLIADVKNGVITSMKELLSEVKELRIEYNKSKDNYQKSLDKILAAVEKADTNNVTEMKEIREQLEELGISADMSKDEIIAAIKENSQKVENNGAVLSKILTYLPAVDKLVDLGIMSYDVLNQLLDIVKEGVSLELSPEMEALIESIADKLDEVINAINTKGDATINELKKVNSNITNVGKDVEDINGKMTAYDAYLQTIVDALSNIDPTVTNIEEIAKEIGVDVAWIREHGGSGGSVDLTELTNYVKQLLAEHEATNAKLDLMLALRNKDSEYLKSLDATTKAMLENEKDFKDVVIAGFAAFGIQMDENNEWLEKIWNKKCDCAKDVTIIVQKIYEYLQGNEGIVDYDDLFDDLYGDDTVAMATKAGETFIYNKPLQNSRHSKPAAIAMSGAKTFKEKLDVVGGLFIDDAMHNSKMPNGVYTYGNQVYAVNNIEKTAPLSTFYETAKRVSEEPTYKDIKNSRNYNNPQEIAKRNAKNSTWNA